MPISITILPTCGPLPPHRGRRVPPRRGSGPRRGRPTRSRDPRPGVRQLRGDAVSRHRLRGRSGPVPTTAGFPVVAQAGLDALAIADTVLVPGFVPHLRVPPAPVLAALRAAARGARMASICTGAFALAAAGVLDGRRATTHWRDTADLASMYPRVRVEPDVLYVDEGTLLTSAGVASGLDLCLHILRTDHGAALASHIARRLVVPPHREGGQAQYVDQPLPTHAGRLTRVHPSLGARAPRRAPHGPHARRPRPRLRTNLRPPLHRRDRRPGPPMAPRPPRRRRPRRPRINRRLDRRDRRHVRLRHRGEPPQTLPPPRLHHPTSYRRPSPLKPETPPKPGLSRFSSPGRDRTRRGLSRDMPRQPRAEHEPGLYHVYARGNPQAADLPR